MTIVTEDHRLPVQRACQIARCARTSFYHALNPQVDKADTDAPVITALQAVVAQHGRS